MSAESGDIGLANGDFVDLEVEGLPLRSSAVFLRDPFLFLAFFCWTTAATAGRGSSPLTASTEPLGETKVSEVLFELLKKDSFENKLPEMLRLWPLAVLSLRSLVVVRIGAWVFSGLGGLSSGRAGNGVMLSFAV